MSIDQKAVLAFLLVLATIMLYVFQVHRAYMLAALVLSLIAMPTVRR